MWYDALQAAQPDWAAIEASFPAYAAMRACIQDPHHHGEGDVWTHTRMVFDEMVALGIDSPEMRLAVLFHDVEKPATREEIDGRISHPQHARRGAKSAWYDLWRRGAPLDQRLAVYRLILWHQKVFHMWEKFERSAEEFERAALTFSEDGGVWRDLIDFAFADNRGRICTDQAQREDQLHLLSFAINDSLAPLEGGTAFPDAHSRVFYMEKEGRTPHFQAPPAAGSRVTVMSGLPASGKDTWVAKNRPGIPVVSADAIRLELGISWEDNQGTVIQATKERARSYLRSGQEFVWNATNLTRQMRQGVIGLCRSYDAHVTVVSLDAPLETILRRNRDREAQVSRDAIAAMALKWEPVTPIEAHAVEWLVNAG